MSSKKYLFWCFSAAVLSCAYLVCSQSLDDDLENLINEIFAQDNNQPDRQCSQIEQELRGCHDCYPCNHSVIAHYDKQRMTEVRQISLINAACTPTKVCCVSQSVLVLNRISPDDCGRRVDTGRRRSKPRAILHGEYPWQAHVFQKQNRDHKFLCAATLIDADARTLVTSATCVRGVPAESLSVSWEVPASQWGKMAAVERVVVHEDYKPDKKHNDIALLRLRSVSDIPAHAAPICLPSAAPPNGLACATVATNDYRINTFIPLRKVCTTGKGVPLDGSQICASTVGGGDYFPRQGAALMCQPPRADNSDAVYVMYGIASFSVNDSLAIYTNVADFLLWLGRHI